MKIWDAIVVGAGPAGCAAAYDLVLAGKEVLLLDRADFPRKKACAGGLTVTALRSLRYSVQPVIERSFSTIRLERDSKRKARLGGLSHHCFMTVREKLDDYCFRQTLAAGAQFRKICSLNSIAQNSSTVEMEIDGSQHRARFLIGADGVYSRVRHLTEPDPRWFRKAFALEASIPYEFVEQQDLVFDLAAIRFGYGWIFPKGDHLNVGLYTNAKDERIDRGRLCAYLRSRNIKSSPTQIIGQYAGFGAASHSLISTRIFLVGDAGGFVNPLTGEGISQAIRSGQAAASAIQSELEGAGSAHRHFIRNTQPLRKQLAVYSAMARAFYSHLDTGYRCFSSPAVHAIAMRLFSTRVFLSNLASKLWK